MEQGALWVSSFEVQSVGKFVCDGECSAEGTMCPIDKSRAKSANLPRTEWELSIDSEGEIGGRVLPLTLGDSLLPFCG